jgi:hypothetical protein
MKLRIAILLLATATLAFSQTTKVNDHQKSEQKSAASASQAMPKPGAEDSKLAKSFAGNWTVTGKTEAGPTGPAETVTGTEKNYSGPGKFSLVTDTTMKFSTMGPFRGHGVMYWDAEAKHYTGTWCDNLGPCATQGIGTWEGDKLIFNSDMKMGGQTAKMRQTYSNITADAFDFAIEMGDPNGNFKPWMTLNFKRAGNPGAPSSVSATPK